MNSLGLRADDAAVLCASRDVAAYFEAVLAAGDVDPRLAANWVITHVAAQLNREGSDIRAARVAPAGLAELLQAVGDNTVSGSAAKDVFEAMWQGEGGALDIIEARGLRQVTDSGAIDAWVEQVLAAHPDQVQQVRDGKHKVIGFLVGKVMQASQGKADPGPGQCPDSAKTGWLIRSRSRTCCSRSCSISARCAVPVVRLDTQYRALLAHPPPGDLLPRLLGESAAATLMMANAMKFTGRLTLQLGSSNAPLAMLVAQARDNLEFRGTAAWAEDLPERDWPPDFATAVRGVHCRVTINSANQRERYQGIVEVAGASLADCLGNFFERSVQSPTRLVLLRR